MKESKYQKGELLRCYHHHVHLLIQISEEPKYLGSGYFTNTLVKHLYLLDKVELSPHKGYSYVLDNSYHIKQSYGKITLEEFKKLYPEKFI